ncbi:hypothetical protein VKT23_007300 [Stygiomarasmius scandens]|uniref:DUF6535 domain-containing protein n=1 Tax=Marasmiellus scandens TaxID=2682957 RepID=A0ABR1JM87_9AGAR
MSQDPARDSSIDVEKGGIETKPTLNGRYKPTADDDACFKLWNTYIEQAWDYDYKLLEGWKGDMDGMLLFSALYSATLTALIVESYQKLQQDPADATLAVLTQVSRQLASMSDGTAAPFQDLPAFELEPSVLICNMLWFLSLALALTCSLLATFVQQWVRDFLHKTTIRPSPVVQARVLAFSYFGLRRFGLHTFVDIIPILLHLSLFLFFAGLVAFLLPINRPLMYLLAGVLVVFMVVYTGLSCMPLVWLDAPYRTPVSDLLWRVGNRLRGSFFRVHRLPNDDLSLTEAMLEMSLRDSSERDRQCMTFTMKLLNHDSELLPMLGAISEAILGPSSVRFANATLIEPLLQAPDPEENIVSRISHFVSVSGTSTDPVQRERDKFISLKALWSLARLVVEQSLRRSHLSLPDSPVFWFERGLTDILIDSDFASDFCMISALALIRTSRLQSLRQCIDIVAEKLSFRGSSSSDQLRLRLAKDAFNNMTLEDVNWTSALFMNQFSELGNVLREGCLPDLSESHARELVQQANALVRGLQSPGQWKAAIISVLEEFLSDAAEAELVPFEMDLTHELICSSIFGVDVFDQSLEVEDDEAEASLLLQNTSQYPSSVLPELFIHIFQLAFSTKRALLIPKCRGIALQYLYNLQGNRGSLINPDAAGHLEQCVLQDLRDDDAFHSSNTVNMIRSLYIGLGLENYSISLRLLRFAKQIFELTPTVSVCFTQSHWWNLYKPYTEWVLCKDILAKLGSLTMGYECDLSPSNSQTLDDICCLGGRLLPDIPVPTHPSPCTANEHKQWGQEIQTYVMSMNLLILSKFVDLIMEDTGGILFGDWVGMQTKLLHYSGHVYDTIQLKFAKSVQKLVSLAPWNQQKDTPAFQVFHEWIWCLSAHNWCWITDVESARILLEAIECHINDKNYRGWIWVERELFNHCTQIIQEAESK